jgi:intracellular sulfur oxidation DsrE/DsrF family protein
MVNHSAGVKFFMKDLAGTPWEKDKIDPDIYKRFVGLTKFGVEAYLCETTFKRLNLELSRLHEAPYIKVVPSGVATVGELQSKSFGCLKVG